METMLASFEPFDATMAREIAARRQKDDENVAAIEAEMSRLKKLLQEARVEASQQGLVSDCEVRLMETKKAFEDLLSAQTSRVLEDLERMETRCDVIEQRFAAEKEEIKKQIEDESLSTLLDEFQRRFDEEKAQRRTREKEIRDELGEHEEKVQTQFKSEQGERSASLARLRKELGHVIASRTQAQDNLAAMCSKEVAKIQDDLQKEIKQRELMDDKIIKALHQYTIKLQSSLIVCLP